MTTTRGPTRDDATARRLLEAAGPVFAERGYRDATVREICAAAGANIAAVSYYYGDKFGLYRAVLREAHGEVRRRHMSGVPGDAKPEVQLRAWVEGFLRKLLDPERPQWLPRLMMREMVEPTAALDEVIEESIRPQFDQLAGIIGALTGRAKAGRWVREEAVAVAGQCLIFRHCPVVLDRMLGVKMTTAAQIDELADAVSARVLRGLEPERGVRPARPKAGAKAVARGGQKRGGVRS
ncbi:MAG: CerR family C-terminal domain-containing protein [Phycisphaerales bacterium]|nr:CerR family C-terminal domain-containing protein [Phycisphaerales bacterium]